MRLMRPSSIMAAGVCYFYTSFVVFAAVSVTTDNTSNFLCPSECSCLGSMVDCSKLGLNSVPRNLPTWVTILELSSNKLDTIDGSAFKHLHHLEELDLSKNEIVSVNANLLQHLPNLRSIKLSNNKLTAIPELDSAANITTLILQHNQITQIDRRTLLGLPSLRSLDLSNNRIRQLTNTTFAKSTSLRHLILTSNRLQTLTAGALNALTSLEVLKLGRNRLQQLPKAVFSQLKHLKHLELSRNRLQTLAGLTFQGLDSIVTLKLRRNGIRSLLDGVFWGLGSIQHLHLDHNNISAVNKAWVYGLNSLQTLSLSHNAIQTVDADSWQYCDSLWELDLSHNAIASIASDTFSRLDSLQYLYVSNNRLSHIDNDAFSKLVALQTLEISHNHISWSIENGKGLFSSLSTLNRLSLEDNQVKVLTKDAFDGLDQLRRLHLGDNPIGSIERNAFEKLSSLQEMRLNTSNLVCNCLLSWLPTWLSESGFQKMITARCAHPSTLKGRSIFDVPLADFKCTDSPMPKIISEPVAAIALRGGNITLECTATSSVESAMSIEWKKDNMVLRDASIENLEQMVSADAAAAAAGNETGDVVVATGNGTSTGSVHFTSRLHISRATDEDSGSYQCVISNRLGSSYSHPAQIDVHVFPKFTKTPVDVTVRSGATARLDCAAVGAPAPQVAWRKDSGGDDFPAARERRMHVMPADDAFFIVRVTQADAGLYSCTASNAAGSVVANATLTVLETPAFARPMAVRREAVRGETAALECLASGSPSPRVEWLKDGRPLTVTPRHFVTAAGQVLVIIKARRSDAGRYTCQLSNTLGRERGDTLLVIRDATGGALAPGGGDNSMTTGIIVIAVVCCVVGTSLIWVVIIYQTRKRADEMSSTPTDETTVGVDGTDDDELTAAAAYYRQQQRLLHVNRYPDSLDRTITRLRGDSMYAGDLDDTDESLEPLTYEARRRLREGSDAYKPLLYSLSSVGASPSDADTDGCASTQSTCSSSGGSRHASYPPPRHGTPPGARHGTRPPDMQSDGDSGVAQDLYSNDLVDDVPPTFGTTFLPHGGAAVPRASHHHIVKPCMHHTPDADITLSDGDDDHSPIKGSASSLVASSPPPSPSASESTVMTPTTCGHAASGWTNSRCASPCYVSVVSPARTTSHAT